MARFDPTRATGRLARAAAEAAARAQHAAQALKAEYDAGKRGDDAPPAPIWGTPKQQLDAIVALLRKPAPAAVATATVDASTGEEADAREIAAVMRGVDWSAVRAATAERGSDAAAAMRTMAEHVDWSKVQPVAAQVSSALIAAVASGRIGVGGPLGGTIARTILGQTGIAEHVAQRLAQADASMPPDFRHAIDTTAREG